MSSKSTKPKAKTPPVAEFKSGAILAAVWLRTTETGMSYLDFSLERLYKPKNAEKWLRSRSFFAQNAQAIAEVSSQAQAFIEQHRDDPEAATPQGSQPPQPAATNGFSQEAARREAV